MYLFKQINVLLLTFVVINLYTVESNLYLFSNDLNQMLELTTEYVQGCKIHYDRLSN